MYQIKIIKHVCDKTYAVTLNNLCRFPNLEISMTFEAEDAFAISPYEMSSLTSSVFVVNAVLVCGVHAGHSSWLTIHSGP